MKATPISLVEINNRIKDTTRKQVKKKAKNYYHTCDKYNIPEFSPPTYSNAKGAHKKWIKKLTKIYTFINGIQYLVNKHNCTVIPISTNMQENRIIFGCPKIISQYICDMITIGLLSIESPTYQFGQQNKCRTYRYYKDNEIKFIQFCRDNNIEPLDIKEKHYNKNVNIHTSYGIDKTKVVFKTNRRLTKPNNLTCSEFETLLTTILYENYPQLRYYINIADEINTLYIDKPELQIKLEPHFTWSINKNMVTKIGIRASSSLNSTNKEKRAGLLKEYGFDMKYDVTSSIPRVLRSLSDGKWFSENIDLYAEIYKNCGYVGKCSKEMRKAIKRLFMRAYFDSTEKKMAHHIWIDMEQDGISKQDVAEQMIKLRKSIEKTCSNKLQGTEAFLAESCIYLRVFQRLLSEGRKGWLLYDCFYCSSLDGENNNAFSAKIEQYLQESFNEYISLY